MKPAIVMTALVLHLLSWAFFCSPTKYAGGETTNGNGLTIAVSGNKLTCRLNASADQLRAGCLTMVVFNAASVPLMPLPSFNKPADTVVVFDSLPSCDYAVLVRNSCDTTAAFIQGIEISPAGTLYTLSDTLQHTISVSGSVAGDNANQKKVVYIKGTDILASCSDAGLFTLANVPPGPCTVVAVSQSLIVGAPGTLSDTLDAVFEMGQVVTGVALSPH